MQRLYVLVFSSGVVAPVRMRRTSVQIRGSSWCLSVLPSDVQVFNTLTRCPLLISRSNMTVSLQGHRPGPTVRMLTTPRPCRVQLHLLSQLSPNSRARSYWQWKCQRTCSFWKARCCSIASCTCCTLKFSVPLMISSSFLLSHGVSQKTQNQHMLRRGDRLIHLSLC